MAYAGSGTTSKSFLFADPQGSIVASADPTGTWQATDTYDEYGVPGSTNTGRFQYTGQAWLPEFGIYSYKARDYAPGLGRFLQTDPIGYGDAPNMYAYVHDDPVDLIDPTGTQCFAGIIDGTPTNTYCTPENGPVADDRNPNPNDLTNRADSDRTGRKGGNPRRITCRGRAYLLAGNKANIGKTGFPGTTVKNGSAAVIPRQFTGALTGGPMMRSIGASAFGTITGPGGTTESFSGISQAIGYAKLGSASDVQNMIMARDPGALVVEIVGGTHTWKDATIVLNIPQTSVGCPAGTQ